MSNPLLYFSHDSLRTFTTDIFKKLDLSSEDAALVSDCLVKADLRGLGSHGVARIPLYAKRLRFKELIAHLAESNRTVLAYVPGKGYVWVKVASLEDDMVTLDSEKGNRVILHYTRFSIKQE